MLSFLYSHINVWGIPYFKIHVHELTKAISTYCMCSNYRYNSWIMDGDVALRVIYL